MKLAAKGLRTLDETKIQSELKELKRRPIYFILENIYDTYNVGGLFRLADALAIKEMYLCGETETPPNSRIKKASIGTYKVVPWIYKKTAKEAIIDLRNNPPDTEPVSLVAVEQHPKAIPYTSQAYSFPLALIFGNETSGILPETLKQADQIVEIPMWGVNKSLNVIVSAAIVSYWVVNSLKSESLPRQP